jgi:hypothetical protein
MADSGNVGSATPTPGSMTSDPGGMGHMVELIGWETSRRGRRLWGGQPLPYREKDGFKVFEITTQAVQWLIMEGVSVWLP